jgi:integrase
MRGIRGEHGVAQRQAKPLLREDLFVVLGAIGDGLKDLRDKAILLLGFAGGLRRSELIAINCNDLERAQQGVILAIRQSKTDQDGVPFSGRSTDTGEVSASRLAGEAVSLIVRDRMAAAGFDPTGYSGHSLRAGFATSATRAGVSTFKIRQQTGHTSDAMLSRYVREGELFLGNPAGILL